MPGKLEDLMLSVARLTERREYRGATPEQVTVLGFVYGLRRDIDRLCQDVVTTGDGPWLPLADKLDLAAERCRNIERFTVEQRLLESGRGDGA